MDFLFSSQAAKDLLLHQEKKNNLTFNLILGEQNKNTSARCFLSR